MSINLCDPRMDPPSTSIESSYSAKDLSQKHVAISHPPDFLSGFTRKLKLYDLGLDVISIDISAHGLFVLVGCSNGMIILFITAIPDHEGVLVGHLLAHFKLFLTVKITEDCRFCFAGAKQFSNEILAIDFGHLPIEFVPKINTNSDFSKLITIYSRFDPKLCGFFDATRVCYPEGHEATYRLVCGRAPKLRIWEFRPESQERWTRIYEIVLNSPYLEHAVFRNGGLEVLTKSFEKILRVWNLCQYESDPTINPTYEDIPNSIDVRASLGNFAVGGIYNFATIKIGAPKESNRECFDMPVGDISYVVGTSDGRHVLFLCNMGGVMYLKNNSSFMDLSPGPEGGSSSEVASTLTEIFTLERNPYIDCESAWALKRVGQTGGVVILSAIKKEMFENLSYSDPEKYTEISVRLLSDVAPREITNTQYPEFKHPDYKNPCLKDPAFLKGRDLCKWEKHYDASEVPVREALEEDSESIFTADTIPTKLRRIEEIIETQKILEKDYSLKLAQKAEKIKQNKLTSQILEYAKIKNEGRNEKALKSVKINRIINDNPQVKKARIIQPERDLKEHKENNSSSSSSSSSSSTYVRADSSSSSSGGQKYAQRYEEESETGSASYSPVMDESPIAPLRNVRTTTLTEELLDSMRKSLRKCYDDNEDNFKKDVLLEIITQNVRPVTPEEFEEFLRFMEEDNILMVFDDDICLI